MKLDITFNIKDKVFINELKRPGRIMAIHINEKGISYQVRFFDNADVKEIYFYCDELKILSG